MIAARRPIDLAYAACLVLAGVLFALLASLGWAWYSEGYGLHPALCLAVAVAVSIATVCARPGSTL